MKNPPTLADCCTASALDKHWYGDQHNRRKLTVQTVLRQVADARKFVLDAPMSQFLAELSDSFWRGGLRKRINMLNNARQLARAPHALTWIEFSYHADYLERIRELKSQGVMDLSGNNPQRMGWLVRQHPQNDAAFMACEVRSSVNVPDRVFVHPVGAAWCADDNPSPWRRFPPADLTAGMHEITSEAVAAMPGYRSAQAHWHGFLGDDLTTAILNDLTHHFAHSEDQITAATKPAVPLRVLWALLATINDLPVKIEFVEPSRGYIAKGSYKKFLTHSVIHLTVPQTLWRKLLHKAAIAMHRRAHQVRGHWRIDWRHRPIKLCEHTWNEEMICRNCGGRMLWIAEHQRGDASLGFVTHDYSVEHERERTS
jgi:hypothetical protein